MHLIHCKDFSLKYYHGPAVVKYLILSHTWGDDEVTFSDMNNNLRGAKQKQGFKKIKGICSMARFEGIPFAWG